MAKQYINTFWKRSLGKPPHSCVRGTGTTQEDLYAKSATKSFCSKDKLVGQQPMKHERGITNEAKVLKIRMIMGGKMQLLWRLHRR